MPPAPISSPPRRLTGRTRAPRGVDQPPGGLGGAAWWGISAGLVALAGLAFLLAAGPLGAALDRLAAAGQSASAGAEPESAPPVAEPAARTEEPRVAEPKAPTWTLVDVEAAVHEVATDLPRLIEEGRAELPEFRHLTATDAARVARARERFAAWGRIWRNRVAVLEAKLPPAAACSVHAAMDPACDELRAVLATVESVAAARSVEEADERFDLAAERLDLFLNPPAASEEEEHVESDDFVDS